ESIFLGLRMNEGIKFIDFYEKYNIDFKEVYEKEINKLNKMKLIEISDEGMILTQKGREISNSVFVEFIK
ncbi:MAG: coproporphyrinogen III oxidase, partial [Terrisporobacter othiniensis]|nr:coproporphyrinogen III oxidase [Terrisporobacter othiniensis]